MEIFPSYDGVGGAGGGGLFYVTSGSKVGTKVQGHVVSASTVANSKKSLAFQQPLTLSATINAGT